MKRILFLLKTRHYSHSLTSYGLINSANHVADFLETKGYKCKVESIIDSNFIDKEVHLFKPDVVIIEALWVTAHKLHEIMDLKRYRDIKWIVRVHSDMGFLSSETHGIKLINDYVELKHPNLTISLNSEKFVESLSDVLKYKFTYLPNIITFKKQEDNWSEDDRHIHIGCFGATRILKNQCFQAICAIQAADILGKKLFFHVTPSICVNEDPVLRNLKELFSHSIHELVIHEWMENDRFQRLIKRMDMGLQLSFTESFNIVSADFINNNKLIVVSDAVDWMPVIMKTSTTNYKEAVRRIIYVYKHRNSVWLKSLATFNLSAYNSGAKREWIWFLRGLL